MIIGTAGHIDHGKSALVEALTGRTVDRLAEERRRGITIDLNFAPLQLGPGTIAGVVDVPGHEDLVRTMIAGASGMQLALLVVAADAGIQPQTLEHLAVLEALGVPDGIPVLTKADLVDHLVRDARIEELRQRLARSSVRFGEPAVVSARTGEGIVELRERLASVSVVSPVPDAFRLPVDRAFSVPGVGTVVTGTAWSGSVKIGDTVRVLPADVTGRVRSIEMYGSPAKESQADARVALGIAGVPREAVGRGSWIVTDALPWQLTSALDVMIALQSTAPHPLAARSRIRAHLGTTEVMARVGSATQIAPGEQGVARLVLEAPILARGGDRIVLRWFSPVVTIGGGVVFDPAPPPRSRAADFTVGMGVVERISALTRRRSAGVVLTDLPVLVGIPASSAEKAIKSVTGIRRIDGHLIATERLLAVQRALGTAVDAHHSREPAAGGASLETLRTGARSPGWLVAAAVDAESKAGRLVVEGGVVRRPDFRAMVPGGESALDALVATVLAGGLTAPDVAELEQSTGHVDVGAALRVAAQDGRVQAVTQRWFVGSAALDGFRRVLEDLGAQGGISVADLRARTGLSRKYLIPLLEWADARGITERRGDLRVVRERRA
ncbi:MAG: selenocysteine-specific translation elongation factor [Gemmatimonadales bacterium]